MNQSIKKPALIRFIAVMIVFFIGMIALIANHIHDWWIWTINIAIWTYIEARIAKDFHLQWWVWMLIIMVLSIIDLIAIDYFS